MKGWHGYTVRDSHFYEHLKNTSSTFEVISRTRASCQSFHFYGWRNTRNSTDKYYQPSNGCGFGYSSKSRRRCFYRLGEIQWQDRRRFLCQQTMWHMPPCSVVKCDRWRTNLNGLLLQCCSSFVLWLRHATSSPWFDWPLCSTITEVWWKTWPC